ncbi:MAG: hypothetical protein GX131_01465 [candidate division WS1 bacterium]|nr:hypothetical protein [candidate division WS1 bacterium]
MTRLGGFFPEEMRHSHASRQVGAGSVFFTHCDFTTPPKCKYVAVLADGEHPLLALINSEVHPFIQARSHLLQLQVPLFAGDYAFLDHDSYLNCARIFQGEFSRAELEGIWSTYPDNCWELTNTTRSEVVSVIGATEVLSEVHRAAILRDLSP